MTTEPLYQLRAVDGWMLISASDVAALGLIDGAVIDERGLRGRLARLGNRSIAEAIHALLDQEEPGFVISVQVWEARK